MQRRQQRGNTLKNTGDRFILDRNDFNKFLPVADPDSWGRLSILQNHKKIMHIMNTNYVKSIEMEKKFHNMTSKDKLKDEEYLQYKEDQTNTLKMGTILRSLNEPKRKRIEEKRRQLEKQRAKTQVQSYSRLRVQPLSPDIRPLKEVEEDDEESVA